MRVLTLDEKAFDRACGELAAMVAASGFQPDLIVGIRRGGEYVAVNIGCHMPESRLDFVTLQRPSTSGGLKNRMKALMGRLPLWMLDYMRVAEAWVLAHREAKPVAGFNLPPQLTGLGRMRVLLVDDAVDSGATMKCVADALVAANPMIELRTAAITVTTPSPVISPDYSLYNNKTLIRFPWSMDAPK